MKRTTAFALLVRAIILIVATAGLAACGGNADQRVARARAQFEEGKYRSALSDVKAVVEREPQHGPARLLLAELSLWLGDLDGAEKDLARALEAGVPKQSTSSLQYEILIARQHYDELLKLLNDDDGLSPTRQLVFRARAQAGLRDYDSARQSLARAIQLSPADPDVLLQQARVEAASGELQRALDLSDRVTQPDLLKARALLLRSSIFILRGEHEKAREALLQAQAAGRARMPLQEQAATLIALIETHLALNDVDAANAALNQLAAWMPKALPTHYLRARVAMLKNDPVTAVAECQQALLADPRHLPSRMLLAAAHFSHGSLEQAESVLDSVLTADPQNVAATKLLAQVYLARGKPEDARRMLAAVAENSPADAQLDWLMGRALLETGDNSGLAALERSLAASPGDVSRRLELAAAYITARQPEKAQSLLKEVPPGSPLAPQVQALTVIASVAGKGIGEARREIERLIAAEPNNVALLTAAGAQLAMSGDMQKARSTLERAAQLDPKAVEARLALARLAAGTRDFDGSRKYLQEVLAIDPRNQRAHLGLSELAWVQGDRARAQAALEEAVGADPTAVEARLRLAQLAFVSGNGARGRELINQAIRVGTDRKAVLNAAGQVLARAGLVEEAVAKFREAMAAGASDAVLNIVRLYENSGRQAEARQTLEAAVAGRPGWREAERMLVELDARAGDVDRALARVRATRDLSPAGTREYEGDVYALAGQFPRALAAYEDALRQQPSAALATKAFRAAVRAGAASPERSLTDWLRRSPSDAQVRSLLAGYYAGSGRPKEAAAEYERLLADDRIDPLSLNNFAWLLHERNDPRALALAKRAHEAAPQVAEIADTYGWILVHQDKTAEGLPLLEKALAALPTNPDIQYHVAAAYVKSGQAARAGEILQRLLGNDEKFPSRAAAEQLARSLTAGGP